MLDAKTRESALMPLILPHVFRHIGWWFLITGVAAPGLSRAFAVPAAYGDLITAGLALRRRVRYAMAIVLIPVIFVPAMLVSHFLIFRTLVRPACSAVPGS